MNSLESKFERLPEPSFTVPAVESFFDAKEAAVTWPEHIADNPDFLEQTERQRWLLEAYRKVINNLPLKVAIDEALEQNLVDQETLISFYDQLANYIKGDPAHARLILYFPFELLSPLLSEARSSELNASLTSFNDAYKKAWETQLSVYEVRANFVDGDVLEPELLSGDHPRTVKATHLIPSLIERGLMTIHEAYTHAESSNDQYVKDGFLDACEVMMDKGIIGNDDLELFKNSADPYLRNGARLLQIPHSSEGQDNEALKPLPIIFSDLDKKLSEINAYEPEHSTPARTAWLRKNARKKALNGCSAEIVKVLKAGDALPQTLTPDTVIASVDALRQASLDDSHIYAQNREWLEAVSLSDQSDELSDALTKLYAHLHSIGLVSNEELQQHDVRIPKLAGPFSENLKPIEPFLDEVKKMALGIENDPYLNERIYPVALVFGSQLKGYGTTNADADVAVFVRQGVDRSERKQLESSLAEVFSHEKIGGKAVMFWLDEKDGSLTIHDWPQIVPSDGESSWVHVLFGAAWTGNKDAITELHHQLLTNYFYDPETKLQGKPTRERWLEEMERDTLQYRLLHKGFERYYPINSPMDTPHGDAIDGASAFYDPRYRRIATELFLSRIFLPRLKR